MRFVAPQREQRISFVSDMIVTSSRFSRYRLFHSLPLDVFSRQKARGRAIKTKAQAKACTLNAWNGALSLRLTGA
jgi:hypothetical protein